MRSRAVFWIFLFVVAPIGAVVVISALLLFGVTPHTVFAPGFAMKSLLASAGLRAPNAVGVLTTVLCWWALIAAIGIAWEALRSRAARPR